MKSIIKVFILTERKVDEDLIQLGFKIKRVVQVPFFYKDMIGSIDD
jgi:hypothetical protein